MTGGKQKEFNTENVLSFTEVAVPTIMVIYGFLAKFGLVSNEYYTSDAVLYILSLVMMGVALITVAKPSLIKPLVKTVTYHILTLLFLTFVTGFSSPFLAVWILLLINTSTHFSIDTSWNSILIFISASALQSFFFLPNDPGAQLKQLITVLTFSALGAIVVIIFHSQKVNQADLVSSKKRESLERERLLTIVNNLTDSMMVVSKTGKIEIFNASTLNLLDTNQSLIGKNINRVLELKDENNKPFNFDKSFKTAKSNLIRNDLTLKVESETIKTELSILPIRVTYSEQKKANQQSFVVIIRDITKEKTLEEERDEFISVVSHELRTPVAIAEGAISNLSLMIEKKAPEAQMKQSVQSTYSEIMFLANMINDLSTLSRAERGVGDNAEIINTKKLGEDLYNKYQKEVSTKGLTLDLDLDSNLKNIKTSRLYLEELLQNIITNSIKYTKEGDVLISIKNEGNSIRFAVTDTGIGISKNDQQKIFNKFYRSEDYRTRETGGTGLGLYVASKLARKMNTKIELQSRLNYGSTFSFKLPSAKD